MYHLPRVCRILVPEIRVRHEMLRVFWYIDMLTCVIYMYSEIALNWTARTTGATCCLPWRLSMKTGRWMRRHMVYTNSAYWDSEVVAARQLANAACVNQKDRWAVGLCCCFVMFISTKTWHWTYYSACVLFVDVEQYRLTVLRDTSVWHCCLCSYSHNWYNQLMQARPQYSMNALVISISHMVQKVSRLMKISLLDVFFRHFCNVPKTHNNSYQQTHHLELNRTVQTILL